MKLRPVAWTLLSAAFVFVCCQVFVRCQRFADKSVRATGDRSPNFYLPLTTAAGYTATLAPGRDPASMAA